MLLEKLLENNKRLVCVGQQLGSENSLLMIGCKFCNVYFVLQGVGKVTPDSVSDKQ